MGIQWTKTSKGDAYDARPDPYHLFVEELPSGSIPSSPWIIQWGWEVNVGGKTVRSGFASDEQDAKDKAVDAMLHHQATHP